MNMNTKIKKSSLYFLLPPILFSFLYGCDSNKQEQKLVQEQKQSSQEQIIKTTTEEKIFLEYIPNQNNYSNIEWILYKEGKNVTYGEQPDNKKVPKKLEDIVFTHTNPKEINLTEWEITSLARLVPLKRLIEKHANYYSNNPMWALQFFNFESALTPCDYNKLSNDFGLGQIKRNSEKLAKELGTSPESIFYSPYMDREKIIFDPETNVIMAMLLQRYNIVKHNLKNSDQVYAIYVRGEPGLNPDGTLSNLTKDKLKGVHERFNLYKKIIPLFRLSKNELSNIKNKDTMKLLEIYHNNIRVEDMYKEELGYFLDDLEKNLKGDARSVLVYDDCVAFAKTLDLVWSIDQSENYRRLSSIGDKLDNLVNEDWLKERVEKTNSILSDAQNISKKK